MKPRERRVELGRRKNESSSELSTSSAAAASSGETSAGAGGGSMLLASSRVGGVRVGRSPCSTSFWLPLIARRGKGVSHYCQRRAAGLAPELGPSCTGPSGRDDDGSLPDSENKDESPADATRQARAGSPRAADPSARPPSKGGHRPPRPSPLAPASPCDARHGSRRRRRRHREVRSDHRRRRRRRQRQQQRQRLCQAREGRRRRRRGCVSGCAFSLAAPQLIRNRSTICFGCSERVQTTTSRPTAVSSRRLVHGRQVR